MDILLVIALQHTSGVRTITAKWLTSVINGKTYKKVGKRRVRDGSKKG